LSSWDGIGVSTYVTCLVTIPQPNFNNLDVYYNIVIVFMILLFLLAVYKFCVTLTPYFLWRFFEKLPYIIYGIMDSNVGPWHVILMVPWDGDKDGGLKVKEKKSSIVTRSKTRGPVISFVKFPPCLYDGFFGWPP
jgi:hypothetical protein